MALTSPGVEVTIVDESQYLPAAPASIPLIVLATATNKADPTSTGIAQATTAANAGKMYRITSQRDLVTLYGNPFFYTSGAGTPIQGYELNEYGLLAAYSALGISNQVFCLRADIDLASLVGSTGRPTGAPTNGAYWVDTTNSTWGINEFNATTGAFTAKSPIVITDLTSLVGGVAGGAPLQSIGTIGDYAVVALFNYNQPTATTAPQYYYKNTNNAWIAVGSSAWQNAWPTLQGTVANPTLTQGDSFDIILSGTNSATISISATNTLAQVVSDINALGWEYLTASSANSKLTLYSAQTGGDDSPYFIRLNNGVGTVLADLGFSQAVTTSQQPQLTYGTSAQQPLWQSGQNAPKPTGSVWIKVSGTGLQPDVSTYNSATANWVAKTPTFAESDWAQIYAADSTGGGAIPAG